MASCIAILTNGNTCSRKAKTAGRCNNHHEMYLLEGPSRTELANLKATYTKNRREIREKYKEQMLNVPESEQERYEDLMNRELRDLSVAHNQKEHELIDRQRNDTDPNRARLDREARERRLEKDRQQREEFEEAYDDTLNRGALHQQPKQEEKPAFPKVENKLKKLALDTQGVHNDDVVVSVKKAVKKLLSVPIPEKYVCKPGELSLTFKEIVYKCDLTKDAFVTFTNRYISTEEDIYSLGKGVYGKVMDGLWQVIITNEHSEEIMKSLKDELQNNIGTCSQGQLTRICNVLAGYIEGYGCLTESVSEILGREMPKLLEIDDIDERLNKGREILTKYNIPQNQQEQWLEPLAYA